MTDSLWQALRKVVGPVDAEAQSVRWVPERWHDVASVSPEAKAAVQALRGIAPDSIGRSDVRAVRNEEGPVAGFVASMIWGFGTTGYGPHRVQEMLASNRTNKPPGQVIAEIMQVAGECGAREGFSALWSGGRTRVHRLGIAFGTKALHFAADDSTPGAPAAVLDMFVHSGAKKLEAGGWGKAPVPDPGRYLTGNHYGAYCNWVSLVASEEDVDPATVEYGLFLLGKSVDQLNQP